MTERMSVSDARKLIKNYGRPKTKKPPKYGNKKSVVDGEKYDSNKERDRHQVLKLLERIGDISQLTRQVEFIISPECILYGKKSAARLYRCDFTYYKNGIYIVEDVKSIITKKNPVYILKRHMMKVVHNIEILET